MQPALKRAAAILLCATVAVACNAHAQEVRTYNGVPLAPNVRCPQSDCHHGFQVFPYARTRSRYGIGCMGDVPPGTTPDPEPPPQSYLVRDIGKAGVPELTQGERAMVVRIQRYIHSKTLRIAWVDHATTHQGFIVFDATDGPCEVWAAGYKVLNGSCNEFYQPGENPYTTHAVPDCFPQDENPPWM